MKNRVDCNYYFSGIKYIAYKSLFLISFQGITQEFADKEYYLVDSLVLEELSENDRHLIDSSLTTYYKANHDTSKINSLDDVCVIGVRV